MQELTSAYRNNDLHTLLRLELEWIQREEGDIERLTDEKLSSYNDVLREQVQDLEQELADLPAHPRYQPLLPYLEIFEAGSDANDIVRLFEIDRRLERVEGDVQRLRSGDPLLEVRKAIQAHRGVWNQVRW